MNMANMASGLNQANFTQAQAGATGDLNRQLTAAQGNQGAVLGTQQNQNAASGGLANNRRICKQQMRCSSILQVEIAPVIAFRARSATSGSRPAKM